MRKIKYPYNTILDKKRFEKKYYNLIREKLDIDIKKLNYLLKRVDNNYNIQVLLTSDFTKLLKINDNIEKSTYKAKIESFFVKKNLLKLKYLYDNLQPHISNFVMENDFDLKSCHYCNIDFVNTFEQHYKFNSIDDFILEAPEEVLTKYGNISPSTAKDIINKRIVNKFVNLIVSKRIYAQISNFINNKSIKDCVKIDLNDVVIKKNHFTLDHVLPKNKFSFFSLSIYNLVPSCSSCNSKFKHMKEFTVNNGLAKICPTSDEFELDELFKFKMNFDVNDIDFENKIKQIKQISDVEVKIENTKSLIGVDEFVKIFRIESRYEYHKYISLNLIENRKIYSDSQINEIGKIFRDNKILIDKETFKKQIFGSVIFEKESAN